MKTLVNLLAAAALVISLSTTAFAQFDTSTSTTTIDRTRTTLPPAAMPPGEVNVTTTTVTSVGIVQDDPAVIAALAALNAGLSRYDLYIMGILNHSQRIDYAAMEKHGDWFAEFPLNDANVNGYLAYLSQRLHLDADQENEAGRIEGHFLADLASLYMAYQNALANAIAARRTQISTIQVTQPTIATPPPEEAPPQRVEVKESTTPAPRRFIRNRDMK